MLRHRQQVWTSLPPYLLEALKRLARRLTQEGPGKVAVSDLLERGARAVLREYGEEPR